ncbi:hypothetical protein H634G_01419 [Metarhizium anisopliae BRIP 53293]|uniref:Uncharacterized protein n=1 Tax=Metarhizium anisopliae BRIP 53293 TaxID=1291518 RepID=A0A0D9PEP1_METAN|nr:hypothetical protein H634G_01419 [Metarhizium anisopliae BRIP 53293]KJK88036.1 hypothetical protein H633G_08122 [Metarhizium anisopliae BRIP 53284]
MSQFPSNQKPPSPEARSATLGSWMETMEDEGLWFKGDGRGNRRQYMLQSEPNPEPSSSRKNFVPCPRQTLITARFDHVKEESGLISETRMLHIEDEKGHGNAANSGNNLQDASIQEIMQYLELANYSVELRDPGRDALPGFGLDNMTEESRLKGLEFDMNNLLPHFNKTISKHDMGEAVYDTKASNNGIETCPVHKCCTCSSVFGDQIEHVGDMDVNNGLPPWTKTSCRITGGLSAKDTTDSNEEHGSPSSVQLSSPRPTPSPRGHVHLLRPVSSCAVGQPVITDDYAHSGAKTGSRVELVTGAEKRHGARKMTDEGLITLGLQDGLPGGISDATTGLSSVTGECWHELETEQNATFFAGNRPSEVHAGRATAESKLPPDIKPLPSFDAANILSLESRALDQPYNLFANTEPEPTSQEEAVPNMADASEHGSAAPTIHAANSGMGTQPVVDAALLTGLRETNGMAGPIQDTTKDVPADFGLGKWTGCDYVEPDIKYARLDTASEFQQQPASSLAWRDISIISWLACYPDDPDKARKLEASTGVAGIRVYPVDIFFDATSNPQVLSKVDRCLLE